MVGRGSIESIASFFAILGGPAFGRRIFLGDFVARLLTNERAHGFLVESFLEQLAIRATRMMILPAVAAILDGARTGVVLSALWLGAV
jgi:hypothetical protein